MSWLENHWFKERIFQRKNITRYHEIHKVYCNNLDTHTYTRLTALFPGLPRWAGTRKVKPIWILLKQETVSGSGISWAICKSAPCSRQTTTPTPHHSVFYRPDALPAAQPTASKHWRQHIHTHPFNGPLSGTTRVSQYQEGKTNLDFTGASDSEWQWHQLDHMQVCTSLQTDNHTSTSPLSFLQAGCPSCHPTNSVKALKATINRIHTIIQWIKSLLSIQCWLKSIGHFRSQHQFISPKFSKRNLQFHICNKFKIISTCRFNNH